MALNEMAERSQASILIDEEEIPLREEVRGACEMLGLDPLELTCEGRAVIGVGGEMRNASLTPSGQRRQDQAQGCRRGRRG
jgi:hydrogenase expression/formation protein HypE